MKQFSQTAPQSMDDVRAELRRQMGYTTAAEEHLMRFADADTLKLACLLTFSEGSEARANLKKVGLMTPGGTPLSGDPLMDWAHHFQESRGVAWAQALTLASRHLAQFPPQPAPDGTIKPCWFFEQKSDFEKFNERAAALVKTGLSHERAVMQAATEMLPARR